MAALEWVLRRQVTYRTHSRLGLVYTRHYNNRTTWACLSSISITSLDHGRHQCNSMHLAVELSSLAVLHPVVPRYLGVASQSQVPLSCLVHLVFALAHAG